MINNLPAWKGLSKVTRVNKPMLLELATPELAKQYTTALAPEKLAEYFAQKNS